MYDDRDYEAREERDHRTRTAAPPSASDAPPDRRASMRAARTESSRSPPRGPRSDNHPSSYHDRERDYQRRGGEANYDDIPRHRRRDSPGYGRGRDRNYRDHDAPKDYHGRRDWRDQSAYDSGDDGYHHERGHRSGPGRPSHTLKLNDIPDWMGRQVVEQAIRDAGVRGLTEVRIKSDDRSRRCYGFAEFTSEDDAASFLEQNYPAFEVTTSDGSSVSIYLEYSRERRQAPPPDDWKCTMCHFENFARRATCKQCQAPRSSENTSDMRLDGQSDECPQQAPSPFVVIRGLASSVNENSLATGIKSLYVDKGPEPRHAPGNAPKLKSTAPVGNTSGIGAKPGSLARVFMIRDKASEISCNYGFAEFATLDDARAAVTKYHASPNFTINSKPATLAFIHSGVFIPYLHPVQGEDERFTFTAQHNPSLRLSYWNPTVYASELTMFNENLYEDKPRDEPASRKDVDSSAAKDSKKRKADKDLAGPSGKKSIAMAPQLRMWANKHAELSGGKGSSKNEAPGTDDSSPATGVNAVGGFTSVAVPAPSAVTISYGDLDIMCCLLCRRKFKSEASLRRHEQLSDMHKANLEDEAMIAKATEELRARGKEPASNYRDRAKERRMANRRHMKPKAAHLPRKETAEPTVAKPAISKGAGLLAKMGWTSGAGLGAGGEGRTNIIETLAYTPGVGLGAEGGKVGDAAEEAARATKNDYSDFVSKAKDKARERYEKMV